MPSLHRASTDALITSFLSLCALTVMVHSSFISVEYSLYVLEQCCLGNFTIFPSLHLPTPFLLPPFLHALSMFIDLLATVDSTELREPGLFYCYTGVGGLICLEGRD